MDGSSGPLATPRTDNELFALYLEGDCEAFRELFRRHARGLFNFAYRMLGSPALAEEVSQEAFTRVVRRPPDLSRGTKFSTYLYQVGRNLCIDELRKRKVRRHAPLDESGRPDGEGRTLAERLPGNGPATDSVAMNSQIRERIDAALEKLPPEQREVFMLREFSDMPFAQVARTVGCSENTAKSRMRYALERLRILLGDLGPEAP
jgi:RNA polymerase sigma-70 factor (ECF subfamily)